jgi:predicted  nucleic acid-binding Zn-ribbon protein
MNPDLQKLIELDKISQEIGRLKDEIASLPKRVAEIETKLSAAKSQVEAAKTAIKNHEATKRKAESEIQDWQQKISKFREQSLAVKTNEQYKALMHEIEFAQKHISDCEEQILTGMDSAEGFANSLKAAEAELKIDTDEVEKEKAHARALTAEDEKKLADLNQQRQSLREGVDPSMFAHYERVAAKRKGAIAAAYDHKCSACNVMMRPQKYNELLSNSELVTCDSCGRILYHDASRQPEAPQSGKGAKGGLRANERAWFYLRTGGESGRFAYFANSKGGCTMRAFDALTGQLLDKVVKKKATFREAFPEFLSDALVLHPEHLNIQQEFEEQLPADMLEEFQLQARIAPGTSAAVPTAQ